MQQPEGRRDADRAKQCSLTAAYASFFLLLTVWLFKPLEKKKNSLLFTIKCMMVLIRRYYTARFDDRADGRGFLLHSNAHA